MLNHLGTIGITEQMLYAICACVVMMVFDFITGFTAAWKNNEIKSTIIREGLFHKVVLFLIIILAWLCELFVFYVPDFGINVPLVIPTCVIIFLMEVVSICENLCKIYPDLKDSKLMELFKFTNGGK